MPCFIEYLNKTKTNSVVFFDMNDDEMDIFASTLTIEHKLIIIIIWSVLVVTGITGMAYTLNLNLIFNNFYFNFTI